MAVPQAFINALKDAATKGIGALAAGAIADVAAGATNTLNPQLNNLFTNQNTLTTFPSDLPNINGDIFCILFQFYKYNRPSILVAPTLIPVGAVALPIPNDLVDRSQQQYDSTESSAAIGAALEGQAANVKAAGIQAATAAVGAALDGANGLAGAGVLNKSLAFAGVAQNPYLSMLYSSPIFKRFTFNWTFIPETSADAHTLNFILNTLRYHSMPDVNSSTGGLLLNYPDMCIPTLLPSGLMMDFKQCVLESVEMNYVVGDQIAFNPAKGPNAIQLTLSLIEIEYWTRSDIASGFGGPTTPFTSIRPYLSGA